MARFYVVDDDGAVLDIVRRFLERDGHEVRCFSSGSAALEKAQTDPPDAVLSDIYMPNGDGIELLLDFSTRSPHVPIIAMSGGGCFPSASVLEDAARLGAVATLEKPISPDHLRDTLERVLGPGDGAEGGRASWNR